MRTKALLKTLGALAATGALAAPVASAQAPVLPGGDSVTSDNMTHVGKFPLMGDGIGGRVVGDIFYATSTVGLFIFDISDPADPQHLGGITTDVHWENEDVPTNGKILGISASLGGTACPVGEQAGGCLNLYDVTDPANPTQISSAVGIGAHTAECVLDCTWFYGSEGQIVDARDPKNPKTLDVTWTEKAIEQGYEVTAVSSSPHDVTEVAPGYVVSSSQPMVLMSLHPEHGGAPDNPVVIASGNNEDARFIHSTEWPRQGKDKFLLVGGESVLGDIVGNGGGPCSDEVAAFMTWDASDVRDGKGGFLKGGTWSMVDEVRPYNGAYVDGGHPDDKFGCSTHWFNYHPSFRNGGEVAVSMYEHGTRIFNVSPEGKLTEVDYALPIAGAASAPYWAKDGKHFYTADYQRGMDIWRWDGTPKPGPEDAPSGVGGGGGGGGDVTPALSLTLGKVTGSVKKGFKAPIACSRACDVAAALSVDKRTARKLRIGRKATKVARASAKGASGRTVLKLKVARKYARKLRKGTKMRLTVKAKAADGRSATGRRTVKAR